MQMKMANPSEYLAKRLSVGLMSHIMINETKRPQCGRNRIVNAARSYSRLQNVRKAWFEYVVDNQEDVIVRNGAAG